MIKVVHIITGLDAGGAEMMLFKLLSGLDRTAFAPIVISLTSIGPVGRQIEALPVPVRALEMQRGFQAPWSLLRLTGWLRTLRPDVVQTWMYHADLIGGLAARFADHRPVAWAIHQSNLEPEYHKRTTLWTVKICAKLSRRLPARIVCCAEASKRVHAAIGYDARKMKVIPNGFDLQAFCPDPMARRSVREELGLPPETPLIGLVGRFNPQKDHRTFVMAAGMLHVQRPDVHFVLCGYDIAWENGELAEWIEKAGIHAVCHLLGRREDTPRLQASLDIATNSSCGEGFSMAVGEAMACGVPCVVTDVGDSAFIVGDTGRVVPPRNPAAICAAWRELLDMSGGGRESLGQAARCRVQEYFSLPTITRQYEQLYKDIVRGHAEGVCPCSRPEVTRD